MSEHNGTNGNGIDFEALDTKDASERGIPIQLKNPKTGAKMVYTASDGTERRVTITLLGRDSEKMRSIATTRSERALTAVMNREPVTDAGTLERENIDDLVAATVAWDGIKLNGETLPCNAANARQLYADPRFRWIAEQLNEALRDRRLFFSHVLSS